MKRILSVFLSLLMVLGAFPMTVLADELREDPVFLSVSPLPDMEYIAGTPYAGFAVEQTKLPEEGLYALTIRRTGDVSDGSELLVSTVDISAVYGRDYVMDDALLKTEVLETTGTILEKSGDELNRQEAQEALANIQSLIEGSTQEADDTVQAAEDAEASEESAAEPADSENLSLAEMKELQSGMPVRETTDSEFTSLAADFLGEMNIDVADYVETSSQTLVVFAPGEYEKTLSFRILEDEESEGEEIFNLLLSAEDEHTAMIEAASSVSFIIEDDEPVVHSVLNFSAAEYTAKDGFVAVVAEREGAVYSYVTAGLRAEAIEEAEVFEETDTEIVFQPYQTEVVTLIPVKGGESDERFLVELYDLKGAVAGDTMAAFVTVPAGCAAEEEAEPEDRRIDDSYLDDFQGGSLMDSYRYDITLERYGDVKIEYKDSSNPNIGTIIDKEKNPIGKYIATKSGIMYSITQDGKGDHKAWIDNDDNTYLYLEYYSGAIWRHGWTQGNYMVYEPVNRYRMMLADLSTGSSYNASRVGFIIENKLGSRQLTYDCKDIGDENSRKPRLATAMFHNNGGTYSPYPWGDNFRLAVYVQRKTNDLNRPSANVYGFVMLYREFNIKVSKPKQLAYRTGELNPDGTPVMTMKYPAEVFSSTSATRYFGQQIQITETVAKGNSKILGTLKGYNIKPAEGTSFFYPTNSTTLTLNDELVRLIDEHTKKLETVGSKVSDGNTYMCRTTIDIEPVYDYRSATVKLLPPTGIPDSAEYHYLDKDLEAARAKGLDSTPPILLWDFGVSSAIRSNMGRNSLNKVKYEAESDSDGNDYYVFTASSLDPNVAGTNLDPYVSVDLPVNNTANLQYVKVRAKNLCAAKAIELYANLEGKGTQGQSCVHVDLSADTDWHTYLIYLPDENIRTAKAIKGANLTSSYWTGKANWLRIDPMWKSGDGAMAEGDQVLIDYVAFFATEEAADSYRSDGVGRGEFHVGDMLNLTVTTPLEGVYFTQYTQNQKVNPGDTAVEKNSSGTLDVVPNEVPGRTIDYTTNEVRCHFTDSQNYIGILMDETAAKYFTVRNLVPKNELAGTVREGESVLITNEDGKSPLERYTPVTGHGYSVILDPTSLNDGTWRPLITIAGTGKKVNGFAADFLAANNAAENVIQITAEKVNPSQYEYFILDGEAFYSAYSLRPQSEELNLSPTMQASVTAGGNTQRIYNSSGELVYSARRYTTTTDDDGMYHIEGLLAKSGDTISIMVDNNDMQQVIYHTLRSSTNRAFRRSATFDELHANTSSGQNENVRLTKDCAVNNPYRIDMPIRTYHSPYVSSVDYYYRKSAVESRYNTVPIMEGDELTLIFTVVLNGADISDLIVTKVARNGVKTILPAKKTSGNDQILTATYEAAPSVEELADGDRFYVQVKAIPAGGTQTIEYTNLDTGLVCYTPETQLPPQYFNYEVPNPYDGDLPVLSDMAGKLDSGKLSWKTVYADEKNKGTSPYAQIITLSVSTEDFKKGREKLDAIRNGTSAPASQSWDEMLDDPNTDVYSLLDKSDQDLYGSIYKENHPGATDDDVKQHFNNNPADKEAYREKAKAGAQKNALSKTGKAKLTASISILLQLEYDFDPVQNEHFYSGGQYIITVCGNLKKTFYWTVFGVPVYLDINGKVTVQFDGRYVTDKGVITAKEMGYADDLTKKVKSEWPWFQFGLGIKLQPGVGICGVLGVRGILDFAFVARVNADPDLEGPNGGVKLTFSGGVGVDLLLFSFDYTIGTISYGTGIFKKGGLHSENAGEYYGLRAFDNGREYAAGALMSTLLPTAKTTLINGAMEFIRPALIDLGDGRTMLLFLRNMSGEDGRNESNASTLVYAIREADGTWAKDANGNIASTVIENDGEADSTFSALRVGDKVYICWTNAVIADDFTENLESAKTSLQSSNIRMVVYDCVSGTFGGIIEVTDDAFINSNAILASEEDRIALYYFKKDIGAAEKMTDLVGLSNNYNTWARKVYDPETGTFLPAAEGVGAEEELIRIQHPIINDPMVTDLSAADFSYTDLNGGRKDYRIYGYTVDRDKDFETVSDRELWVQVTNLTDGRSYYPVPIDANRESILDPKLTKLDGDVYLTWLDDDSVYNIISANDLFFSLDNEFGTNGSGSVSSLERIRNLTDGEIAQEGWYKLPYASVSGEDHASENYAKLYDLSAANLIGSSHDFGSTAADGTHEGSVLTGHSLVAGGDGNLYLFWTSQDNEDLQYDFGRELYGAAMYRQETGSGLMVENESGEEAPETGSTVEIKTGTPFWSNPVKLTDYGKVIDELTVSVAADKSAILVGNLYTQEIEPDGDVVYSDHELAEIDFIPGNSLKFSERSISLSDYYPVEGEEVTATLTVENNGLLPAETYELIVNGETTTVTDAVVNPGSSVSSEKTFTAGPGGDLTVSAEVLELDGVQTLALKGNGDNQAVAQTKTGPVMKFGDATIYSMPEDIIPLIDTSVLEDIGNEDFETQFNALLEPFDPDIQAVLRATADSSTYADYVLCVPVTNIGNVDGINLKMTATALDDTQEGVLENGVLGDTTIDLVPVKKLVPAETPDGETVVATETVYAVIPLRSLNALKHLDKMGVMRVKATFTLNGVELEDSLFARRQILRNVTLDVNDGVSEITVKAGDTVQLNTTAYPWDGLKDLSYYSFDNGVAMISPDGLAVGMSEGWTYLIVEDMSSVPLYTMIRVNVLPADEETEYGQPRWDVSDPDDVTATFIPADGGEAVTVPATVEIIAEIPATRNSDGYITYEATAVGPDGKVYTYRWTVRLEKTGGGSGSSWGGNTPSVWDLIHGLIPGNPAGSERPTNPPVIGPPEMTPAVKTPEAGFPFTDVAAADSFYNDVKFVYDNGIMNGVSATKFDPYSTLTRGMVVTILHRLEGTPETAFAGVFEDVEPGIWYSDAVEWAADEGIVNGYGNGKFGPNDPVTSEQLAAILHRYANYKSFRTEAADPVPGESSDWAVEYVRWAVVNEILAIDDSYARPATRFEVASAIHAFCDLYTMFH